MNLRSFTQLPTSASRRVALNTGILYAKMGITVFISLYATRLILNSLGKSDYGTFGVVAGVIAMLGFLNNAMASATQRFMSYSEGEGDKEKQKSIFNVSMILHFCIAILMGIILLIAGYFFFNGILNIPQERIFAARVVYYLMIVSTMFTIVTVPFDAVINAHENMLYYAVVGIIEAILKLVIAIVVVFTVSDKLIIYGALMAGLSVLVMLIMGAYCYKNYEECTFHPKIHFNKDIMKQMTNFSGWNLLGSSSSMLMNYGQSIVVNMFFGTIINAAQGVAAQINGQLCILATTMMKALNPVIAKSEGAGNRELMFQATMSGSKISFFLMALPSIPILIEMPFIFDFWLKDVPQFAVIFCCLSIVRSLIEQLFLPVAYSIAVHGNIKKYEITSSIVCCFPLVVSYFLFKSGYPAYILYYIFIIYAIVVAGVILFFAWNNYRFPVITFLKKVLLKSICVYAIVLGITFIPFYLLDSGWLRLLIVLTVGVVSFLPVAWLVGLDDDEKDMFRRSFAPVIQKVVPRKFIKMFSLEI